MRSINFEGGVPDPGRGEASEKRPYAYPDPLGAKHAVAVPTPAADSSRFARNRRRSLSPDTELERGQTI